MKVALIAPPGGSNLSPNQALLSLSSRLHSNKIGVDLHDLNADCFNFVSVEFRDWWESENYFKWENLESFNQFWDSNKSFFFKQINIISESKPDMLFFYINSSAKNIGHKIASLLRDILPKVPIVFGGPDCISSESHTEHMIPSVVDALCPYESNLAIADIVDAIDENGFIPVDIPGFLTWENGTIRNNGEPKPSTKIDRFNPVSLGEINASKYQKSLSSPKESFANEKVKTINSFIDFLAGKNMPSAPLEVFLEVSNVCNLKCAMCPSFSGLNKNRFHILKRTQRGFFDINQNKIALEEVLKKTLNVHCFGYGEPTIHPEFKDFLKFLGRYEVMLDFFTNGMNFNEELCELLVKEHVHTVTISFSGVTKTEYENVYIGGVFEEVLGGIKRLADTKKAHNSLYPKIEVNSLSFEHHVNKLPQFIELMAEHGVNIIHLKSLQQHESIPELSGHKAVYRDWIEGHLVKEAKEVAAKRGIIFSASQFEGLKVNSEEDWKREKYRTCTDKSQVENDFVPLASLKAKAKTTKPYKASNEGREEPRVNVMDVADKEVNQVLQMEKFSDSQGSSFHCLEPFKTMYVNRDGTIKGCCFSDHNAPNLGSVNSDSLDEIWNGKGFSAVRAGALNSSYSKKKCNFCLKNSIGPKEHFTHSKIGEYIEWYKRSYNIELMDSPTDKILSYGSNTDIALRQGVETKENLSVNDEALNIEGHLDRIVNGVIYGWAWSPKDPIDRQEVTIYINEKEVAKVKASDYRSDLKEAGKGDGFYSFSYEIPDDLRNSTKLRINAKIEHLDFTLRGEDIIL